MNSGVPLSTRTASCAVLITGLAYRVCEASAAGSKKSSNMLDTVLALCSSAVKRPAASAPIRKRWRVGERWPTGPYICSRRSTSLTGLFTRRAAMMPRICGPEIKPLQPKPPPRKGLRICTFSGAMPNRPAMRDCAIASPWLGVSIESLSRSHVAVIACGSIGLWYCAGVS